MDFSIDAGLLMNDGRRIPRMGFGTYELLDAGKLHLAIEAAVDSGYRLIDCARFYNNEKLVGDALAACGANRDELFITSKVWNDRQIDGTVRESVEETLRDLQLDYLDLLLIHWPVEGHYVGTWETFIALREEDLVRSIGVSNHLPEHIEAIMQATGVKPAVDQVEHHPYMQDEQVISFCRKHEIIVEAWSPLGRGECLNDPAIAEIAKAHDASAAQVILAWQMAHDVIPIPRSEKPARIRENAKAAAITLSSAEVTLLDGLNRGTPVNKDIDPVHFAEQLNGLSSHFG